MAINFFALFGSTFFHVSPLNFREDPIIAPSVTLSISLTLFKFTPVFASTGVLGIIFFTSFISSKLADYPVIFPETNIASGIDEKTVLSALSAIFLLSNEYANSAEIL